MPDQKLPDDRCRLVLIAPWRENPAELLRQALSGGDVASVIVPQGELSPADYSALVEAITPIAQSAGAAVILENDSQTMGRVGADGLFVSADIAFLKDTIARFSPKRIVGCVGIKTRHGAMEAAECRPDFLFPGRLDGDIRPEAHPKNLKLGEWAAEVMQTSVIVMGGNVVESVVEVAKTGVDFVALSRAVFDDERGPASAVQEANDLLERHAPRFEDEF